MLRLRWHVNIKDPELDQLLGATQVGRAPDLSQRSETAGRWPRLSTGENGKPILDG